MREWMSIPAFLKQEAEFKKTQDTKGRVSKHLDTFLPLAVSAAVIVSVPLQVSEFAVGADFTTNWAN